MLTTLSRTHPSTRQCVSSLARRMAISAPHCKKEGDISSVFTSLSGDSTGPLDTRFAQLKRRLIERHERDLETSWKKLLRVLVQQNRLILEKGSDIVPQIEFSSLSALPKDFEDEVRTRGVAVIKGVIPKDEARAYKLDIEDYVRANPWTRAFPQHAPAVYELYWSKAQVKARSHPNLMAAQRYLMSLWRSSDPHVLVSTKQPVAYADRARIRQPGDAGFALGPHVDGGSVERWEEDGYGVGNVYDRIFQGRWEDYDPWDVAGRLSAVTDLYNSAGGCSMFRMFQGWLSMSQTGPGEGTLMINPLLQLSTAYFLLRPFFQPIKQPQAGVARESDHQYLHEDNWVLEPETSSLIQGAGAGVSQELNDVLHPHLDLTSTMVHIPRVDPGDFVVWHCDTIHAVDKVHNGTSDSSVLYIPVCPLTKTNVEYLVRQREAFVAGHPGPDFPGGKGESQHSGRPSRQFLQENLSLDGLRAMGFAAFDRVPNAGPGEAEVIIRANAELGFT